MISRPRRRSWHNHPDDQGQVIAEFFDVNGTLLGTIATPLQHVGTSGWVEGTTSGAVPPGARQVRVKLRAVLLQDPPYAKEIERNGRIEAVQGNRNPYVDRPELVCRS